MTTNHNSQSGAGMKFLLVRPPVTLKIARRLKAFLHLEPLALEIVAGGIPSRHQTRILDLACEKSPERAFKRALEEFQPDVLGFTAYSNEAATVKRLAGMAKAHRPGVVVVVGAVVVVPAVVVVVVAWPLVVVVCTAVVVVVARSRQTRLSIWASARRPCAPT